MSGGLASGLGQKVRGRGTPGDRGPWQQCTGAPLRVSRNERNLPKAAGVSPDPAPRPDAYGSAWGQTPLPVQEPTATAHGARTGALSILGVLLLALIVVVTVVLVRA